MHDVSKHGRLINMRDTRKSGLQVLVFALLMSVPLWLATLANLDASGGRHELFMDERITFDGVRAILHAPDWTSLAWSLIDGGDQRYGRSLWNLMALVAAWPESQWGAQGQIVAGRMLQACLLAASCTLFAMALLKHWLSRLTLLTALMAMPFSGYYMTMPKPEPLQILFLAAFVTSQRSRLHFGWHWIWLGLAFGTKISTLPAILVAWALTAVYQRSTTRHGASPQSHKQALLGFLVGWGLAVPVLIPSLALYLVVWFAANARLNPHGHAVRKWLIGLIDLCIVVLLTGQWIRYWLKATFRNTTHGADQSGVSLASWLDYFLHTWMNAPLWASAGVILSAGGFLGLMCRAYWPRGTTTPERPAQTDQKTAWLLVLSGGGMVAAIFLATHRLWGFYLVPGMTLLLVGIVALADTELTPESGKWRPERVAAWLTMLCILLLALTCWAPASKRQLNDMATRSQQPQHQLERDSHRQIQQTLEALAKREKRRLTVALDPYIWPIESNERHDVREFWGPYLGWQEPVDVIIFSQIHTPLGTPYPPTSPEYPQYLDERKNYSSLVRERHEACPTPNCFFRAAKLPNGGEILLSSQLASRHAPPPEPAR